jgi:hypothetical protein
VPTYPTAKATANTANSRIANSFFILSHLLCGFRFIKKADPFLGPA